MLKLLLQLSFFSFVVLSCVTHNSKGPSDGDDFGYDDRSVTRATGIPSRSPHAMTGSAFIKKISYMTLKDRETAIEREILSGNIPDFLRKLKPVRFSYTDKAGKLHKGTIFVMPDYLAIGSNDDFVRIPMTPITAQRIADRFGFIFPTTKMVDTIYNQAEVKLTPKPLPAGPKMVSSEYYKKHNEMIERQGAPKGKLVSGHKKDIVVTNILINRPYRVAIYGWHRGSGRPIQPLSTVHPNTYADYSHGVRLVSSTMIFDGKSVSLANIMHDANTAQLVSREGVIHNVRVKTSGWYVAGPVKTVKSSAKNRFASAKRR